MSLGATCDAIAAIHGETSAGEIAELAAKCEKYLGNVAEILDAVENALAISSGRQTLLLWLFVDKLAKQHTIFLDALRHKLIHLAVHYCPKGEAEYQEFALLLEHSFAVLFGDPMISLITMELQESRGGASGTAAATAAAAPTTGSTDRPERTLTVHRRALQSLGGFSARTSYFDRQGPNKHELQVKTLDSQMSMNVASSYAPAQPVEIVVPHHTPDADAPQGYMKALPADHTRNIREERRKRLREVMERNRELENSRQEQRLLERVRQQNGTDEEDGAAHAEEDGERGGARSGALQNTTGGGSGVAAPDRYDDIRMPTEFPRDEYGVKIGNYPLGVRFLRNAIRACGGAVELEVLSSRIASMASREVVSNFGNLREFLRIHSPTFRLSLEKDQWIVRLTENPPSEDSPTWEKMECPDCTKIIRGRNLAWHRNCRSCITAQIARGTQEHVSSPAARYPNDPMSRGPIAELAHSAMRILHQPDTFDDGDVDMLAQSLLKSAEVRRFRLSSTRCFAPILKAIHVIRDRWLARKGVAEMDEAIASNDDASVARLFSILGRCVHRLPIPWIEMGDIIDMCHRFSTRVLPPFHPPPRPADPRISLHNEYPGFLLCESEIEDEDEPSGDEEQFSDEDAPTFTFAPPVEVAESLFTAGFPRDTKRLQHRMRTAPPMVLSRVLKGDRTQTLRDMYASTAQQPQVIARPPQLPQRPRTAGGGGGGLRPPPTEREQRLRARTLEEEEAKEEEGGGGGVEDPSTCIYSNNNNNNNNKHHDLDERERAREEEKDRWGGPLSFPVSLSPCFCCLRCTRTIRHQLYLFHEGFAPTQVVFLCVSLKMNVN
eukprot:gene3734-2631_t